MQSRTLPIFRTSAWSSALVLALIALTPAALAKEKEKQEGEEVFSGPVPVLSVQVSPEGVETLRQYHQVWRQKRPERIDVRATVREGTTVYPDVAVHLKGTFSFQPFDSRPSLTLNFDKFVPGRRFHGLTKIHLNNAVQDPTALCEQFARELFKEQGIVSARATPAMLRLNGREMGPYVLVEGVNKRFVERNFGAAAAKGNLYDGGSGGDVTKELAVISGAKPEDRSDLKALVEAAGEADPVKRLARLERVLDVDQFITFAAIEAILVHWDGYSIGCNNYRLFHDAVRDRFVFMPHGMDQLFGTSSSTSLSLTPVFRGTVAKALFTIPEARQRYLRRIAELSAKALAAEALCAHVDRLAKRLRAALPEEQRPALADSVRSLKAAIGDRLANVAEQLRNAPRPLQLPPDGAPARLTTWRFKTDSTYNARGERTRIDRRDLIRVTSGAGGSGAGGTWRTTLFLDEGHYEFTGMARTQGVPAGTDTAPAGIVLRMSGDTSTAGFALSEEWRAFTCGFDVRGLENVELVCEFRGADGLGEFDAGSLRLARTGPAEAAKAVKAKDAAAVEK